VVARPALVDHAIVSVVIVGVVSEEHDHSITRHTAGCDWVTTGATMGAALH
jgi:hypothetical protein